MARLEGKIIARLMARRSIAALCLCALCVYAGISGLIGLMPLYLTRLGADAGQTGRFLAVVYLCLAASTAAAGKLAHRSARRKLWLILGGLLAAPLCWAMSRATSISAALAVLACLWFVTGFPIAMLSILAGRAAEPGRRGRGRTFGALTLSASLGLLLGSLASGPVVDRWGFSGLFTAFGWFYLLIPVAGRLVDDPTTGPAHMPDASISTKMMGGRAFVLLLVASVVAQAVNITLFLSRALIMDRYGYDATAISGASAAGTVLTLPLPLVLGWLADRADRKLLLLACFAAPVLGLLVQVSAAQLWQFWLASALSTVVGASIVVASVVITDLFAAHTLSVRLALLNATPWIGIVVGLTAGGAAIQWLQATSALELALAPGLGALLLVLILPRSISQARS
ncbi:MAG: MFS transporter [Chloroflexi bacterium]|nr:MFS transporter [Chloroflexota bacterium]